MAKLNGASALPAEAQRFLASYRKLLGEMTEAEATEATILLVYKAYYAEMGGLGTPPDVRPRKAEPATDNVTAFRRPASRPARQHNLPFNAGNRPQLPVMLIFACLVVIYVGIRYFWGSSPP